MWNNSKSEYKQSATERHKVNSYEFMMWRFYMFREEQKTQIKAEKLTHKFYSERTDQTQGGFYHGRFKINFR